MLAILDSSQIEAEPVFQFVRPSWSAQMANPLPSIITLRIALELLTESYPANRNNQDFQRIQNLTEARTEQRLNELEKWETDFGGCLSWIYHANSREYLGLILAYNRLKQRNFIFTIINDKELTVHFVETKTKTKPWKVYSL